MTVSTAISIEDRFAVMDLLARYVRAIDARDAEAYAALFAPDGLRIDDAGSERQTQRGRAEIQAEIQRTFDSWTAKVRHFMGQSSIEGERDRCTARTYVQELVELAGGPCAISMVAEYQDVCVKRDGQWFFQERAIVLLLDGHGEQLKTRR